jgi:hypothetical protein
MRLLITANRFLIYIYIYKYVLGVFDKESQSLKIVPVACDGVSLLFGS